MPGSDCADCAGWRTAAGLFRTFFAVSTDISEGLARIELNLQFALPALTREMNFMRDAACLCVTAANMGKPLAKMVVEMDDIMSSERHDDYKEFDPHCRRLKSSCKTLWEASQQLIAIQVPLTTNSLMMGSEMQSATTLSSVKFVSMPLALVWGFQRVRPFGFLLVRR